MGGVASRVADDRLWADSLDAYAESFGAHLVHHAELVLAYGHVWPVTSPSRAPHRLTDGARRLEVGLADRWARGAGLCDASSACAARHLARGPLTRGVAAQSSNKMRALHPGH